MSKIKEVKARQLIDCKCRPMVEVDVITENGSLGRGSAPTGSSVGMYESFVLRDNDPKEYNGMSVHKAVENVNKIIAPALVGKEVSAQDEIDKIMIELDGTPDKHNLGGNAIYSASIAAFRAAAEDAGKPLYEYIAGEPIRDVPIPSFNVINGGKYPGLTQAFNEFIVMPYKADSIYEAVEIAVKVFQKLGPVIKNYTKKEPGVGGSYGWIAPSEDPDVLLSLMSEAIDACGYTGKCAFALDCASSEMYDAATKTYYLNGKRLSSDELIGYVKGLTERWNFVFIEDMLDENDWEGYEMAHKEISPYAHNRRRLHRDEQRTHRARLLDQLDRRLHPEAEPGRDDKRGARRLPLRKGARTASHPIWTFRRRHRRRSDGPRRRPRRKLHQKRLPTLRRENRQTQLPDARSRPESRLRDVGHNFARALLGDYCAYRIQIRRAKR